MKLASFPVNTRGEFLLQGRRSNIGAKKKPRKNVALSSNREASNRVEKCHSENPNEWITVSLVNDNHYQMVNTVNLSAEKCIGSTPAGLLFGDFGAQTAYFGLQSLNPVFQFGHRYCIEIFADNHVGGLLRGVIKVHVRCPYSLRYFGIADRH
jgi:hypothetical protein